MPGLPHISNKSINGFNNYRVAFGKSFKETRRPIGRLAHLAFQRAHNQLIPADSQRPRLSIDGIEQTFGEMYAGWHDYICDYSYRDAECPARPISPR